MTPKEKKEYIALGIIFGLMILLLAYYFFGNKPSAKPATTITVTDMPASTGTAANPAATPAASTYSGPLLPNGTKLDLSPLSDPRFTSLVPPVYPKVQPQEVGSQNPFTIPQ